MNEKAFIVKEGSPLYTNYIAEHEEAARLKALARGFLKAHDIETERFNQSERLGLDLSPEQRKEYEKQLLKNMDKYGMSIFRKDSELQKAWKEEVNKFVDFDVLYATWGWTTECNVTDGCFSLWDHDGVLYGFLASKDDIRLADYMEEMELSDYYKLIEGIEEERKNEHR